MKGVEKMSVVGAFIVPHPPIILPEIGRGEEQKIHKTIDAYRQVASMIAKLEPDTVIITSPHAISYADYFHISPGENTKGDLSQFGAADVSVSVPYDSKFVQALTDAADEVNLPAGTFGARDNTLDHGTLIPLRFLNEVLTDYKVVRIGLSGRSVTDHYRLGKCIADTAEKLEQRTVIVASGDLSHKLTKDGPYGFAPEGPEFDKQVTQAMAKGNFLAFLNFSPDFCEAAAQCGLNSFIIMAGALDKKAVQPRFLSYEGPFGVGYAVCAYEITGEDESRCFDAIYESERQERLSAAIASEDAYVKLARFSLESYINSGVHAKLPNDLPTEMLISKAGVFVSLKKFGTLRGCIGTIAPETDCIAQEILHNAVSAGAEDPRFMPVTKEELPDIVYSVDVLAKPEPIKDAKQLDAKRYGVIVNSKGRRGLLLPNLEGVDTPQQQIDIAMKKAGIVRNEAYTLERFEVVRHK